MLPIYSGNLIIDSGSVLFTLPTALNDPIGSYVIRATDIVSGATVETRLLLK